jgi:hypothetical protein
MNKKTATALIILIVLIFTGYIVFDLVFNDEKIKPGNEVKSESVKNDMWFVSKVLEPGEGKLKAVAVQASGIIYLAGESFISSYDTDYKIKWTYRTDKPVVAIAVSGDSIFAATMETIIVLNISGEYIQEWGPYEDNAIITSVTSNNNLVAFSDAGNKIIMVLDKKGNVRSMIGQSGEAFIIPSPYFDVALDNRKNLFVANTGHRRVETRSLEGTLLSYFGEPGTAPEAFCGCCNPAHFAVIPGGFVTSEKGINRIKILDEKGGFVEFVSSENNFMASVPLDVASADGITIYAANPADSKLYIFRKK